MKVAITGGGGFLGGHIIKLLLKEGYEVTNFSRGHYPHLEEQGVKTVQTDISSLDSLGELKKALAGHQVMIHSASKVAMWGNYQDFYKTNVTGTENIVKACKEVGVKALIYTSTPSVAFGMESLEGVNEEHPYPKKSVSFYGKTKAIAERYVLQNNGPHLKCVSLRPHLIFGPGDKNLIPRLISKAARGKLRQIGSGKNKVDILYVENAAQAHILAMKELLKEDSPCAGEAFFLGQGPINLWDFINTILKLHQISPVRKKIPFSWAYALGLIIEKTLGLLHLYNVEPPMTRFVALQLGHHHYFSHEKAERLLGWRPQISIEEGLKRLRD